MCVFKGVGEYVDDACDRTHQEGHPGRHTGTCIQHESQTGFQGMLP